MENKLTDIRNPNELASFLGIEYSRHLIYHIYVVPEDERYVNFEIPKRSGGKRKISAPRIHLKTIQTLLAEKLEEIYIPQKPAHGFVKSRSIITNAYQHISRKYVLNLDLEDFFGTINFGRVRGMFIAHPYKLPKELATVIAQICCYKNALPQGAPTSPIISNMICSKMDVDLRRLAQRSSCRYTRYADDITFSTNNNIFPLEIANPKYTNDKKRNVTIGNELRKIINGNGFKINKNKSRLQARTDRQEVTGLVTNKKLNVNRKFMRNTRAMLNSWKFQGLQEATNKHYKKNSSNYISDIKEPTDIEQILRGRIEFIRSVRGSGFSTYITLAKKYNELIGPDIKKLPVPSDEFLTLLNQNVFLIQNSTDIGNAFRMGTAFYLEEINGFVTCYHVTEKDPNPDIKDDCEDFWIIHPKAPNKPYLLKFRAGKSQPIDIAIFDLVDTDSFKTDHPEHEPLKLRNPFTEPQTDEAITLTGWPKFSDGDTVTIKRGHIYAINTTPSIKLLYVTEQIIAGNSGGPVLDSNNRVIGIATRGNNPQNAQEVAEHIAISADHILKL